MLARYELNRERDETIFAGAECDNVCNVHFHRKVEVMYVLEGEKKIFASGKELTLRGDNIYFANSYEMHGYAESPGSRQTVIVFPNLMLRGFYDVFADKIMNRCGLGGAGADVVAESGRPVLRRVGTQDQFGMSAPYDRLLAMNGINIKNIGIVHNREFEEGVLRIEFYEEPDCSKALTILENRNYTVRKRQ